MRVKRILLILALFGGAVSLLLAAPSRPVPSPVTPPSVPLCDSRDERVSLPWSEDFESNAPSWGFNGFFHVIADPQLHQVMNPLINPRLVTLPDAGALPSAHGGNHALWYGEAWTGTFIGSDFDQNQPPLSGGTSQLPNTGWAITPELDLTSVTDATLSFWTLWEVEGVDIPWFDLMYVEASVDGGATWSPVGSGTLNPLNDVNTNPNVGYSSGGIGLPPAWVQHSFSLANFCGSLCWLRFRFATVDQLYNGFRGWFIDDISVEGTGQSLAPLISDVVPGAGQTGDIVYVHGQNFQSGAEIVVGGVSTESAVLSTVLAQFIVPALPEGNYNVMLTNPDGQFDTCTDCFEITIVQGPEISFVDPDWAYPGLPTPIVIQGQNFEPTTSVTIGGQVPTDIVVVTPERITCVTPGTLGLGFHAVRVTNPDGQYDQCTGCFEVRIPEAPVDVVIQCTPVDVFLHWSPVPWAGAEYRIYRDTAPNGPFSLMVGDVADTFYVDHDALDTPGNKFFVVIAYVP